MLSFTPAPNAEGSATVEVRLVDGAGGERRLGVRVSLTIAVRAVDDAPSIAVGRAFECGGGSGTLHLRVDDVDDAGSQLVLSPSVSAKGIGLGACGRRLGSQPEDHRARPPQPGDADRRGCRTSSNSASTTIAVLVGTDGAETITGSIGSDLVFGRGGSDTLRGGDGNDLMCGGHGSDRVDGGAGDDVMLGGAGRDVLRGGDGNDVLRGGIGHDRLFGGAGDDILRGGSGADRFAAAPGNDRLLDFNARLGDRR